MSRRIDRERLCASRFCTNIPRGLSELMSDITREVLREQPAENEVYKFIADYIDSLIATRESAKITNDVLEEILEMTHKIGSILVKHGVEYERASQSAQIIQKAFRDFLMARESTGAASAPFREDKVLESLIDECQLKENEVHTAKLLIRRTFKDIFRKYFNVIRATLAFSENQTFVGKGSNVYVKAGSSLIDEIEAATKIQAAFRGYLVRKSISSKTALASLEKKVLGLEGELVSDRKEDKLQESDTNQEINSSDKLPKKKFSVKEQEAAETIQGAFRDYKARIRASIGKPATIHVSGFNQVSGGEASKLIKGGFNTYAERKGLARTLRKSVVFNESAINLKTKGPIQEKLEEKAQPEDIERAAVKVQALYRGYRTRRSLNLANLEKPNEIVEDQTATPSCQMEEAAKKIQTSWKQHKAREQAKRIPRAKMNKPKDKENENDAAVKIQSAYKGHRVRRELQEKNKAVTKIQAAFRGHLTRKELKKQNDAAVKIQSAFKGHLARKDLAHKDD